MTPSTPPPSLASRLGILLFSGLFALGFGSGGLFFGVSPLVRTFHAAWSVQSWEPVPAQVLSSELVFNNSSEATTHKVQAHYRYNAGGRSHDANRIGVDPSDVSDNVGAWHQDWHARLSLAQSTGQTVTAWVNPSDPSQAVLEPSVRWSMVLFRLPFAFVFTGVGAVAFWVFLRTLIWRDGAPFEGFGKGGGLAPLAGAGSGTVARNSASRSQAFLWFFALFWCGIAFPLAGVFWLGGAPWWVKVFTSVFVLVGIAVLVMAVRQSVLAWRYAGTELQTLPSPPRAGESVAVELSLSARARSDGAGPAAGAARRLRLAQYRVDDSGSGSQERQVEAFDQVATVVPNLQGGERWRVQFELPDDAPTHGGRRAGERVDWRLEILDGDGKVEVSYDLPVQAAMASSQTPVDRFDQRAQWADEVSIPAPVEVVDAVVGDTSTPLPASVQVFERPEAWEMRFRQPGWIWAGALALMAGAVIVGFWWTTAARAPWTEALSSGRWWLLALLLLFGLHAVSRRRSVTLRDDAVVVRIHSWMWTTTQQLRPWAIDHLFHKLLYSQGGSGRSAQAFHAVHARESEIAPSVRLTPGLPGAPSAVAVANAIQAAHGHRQGRFSAGAMRSPTQAGWRPGAGWLLWGAMLGASAFGPRWLLGPPLPDSPVAERVWEHKLRPVDAQLVNAQDAGNSTALAAALEAGANADLLNARGSSMLMLAARRGQLEHVDLLLRHGAAPDLRQTQRDSERGDTALLRAFYGGHLAVAQRLVQGGATLRVKNRWDWGPVHMAAQSGCVPCLDWLAGQGVPLDEGAPASKGETPAMLTAAKGQVEALAWFESRGVDLRSLDPQGQDALAWARWGHQKAAEEWLLARPPAR